MGQFFISDKSIRFDCDCKNPYQPIVNKKAKSIKCERCKKKFTNPFHKSNPYNLDERYINPPQVQGVDLNNYRLIVITITLILHKHIYIKMMLRFFTKNLSS